MDCVKTGVRVVYGTDHVYSGDEFCCPKCGALVIHANNLSYHDPDVLTREKPSNIRQMPEEV